MNARLVGFIFLAVLAAGVALSGVRIRLQTADGSLSIQDLKVELYRWRRDGGFEGTEGYRASQFNLPLTLARMLPLGWVEPGSETATTTIYTDSDGSLRYYPPGGWICWMAVVRIPLSSIPGGSTVSLAYLQMQLYYKSVSTASYGWLNVSTVNPEDTSSTNAANLFNLVLTKTVGLGSKTLSTGTNSFDVASSVQEALDRGYDSFVFVTYSSLAPKDGSSSIALNNDQYYLASGGGNTVTSSSVQWYSRENSGGSYAPKLYLKYTPATPVSQSKVSFTWSASSRYTVACLSDRGRTLDTFNATVNVYHAVDSPGGWVLAYSYTYTNTTAVAGELFETPWFDLLTGSYSQGDHTYYWKIEVVLEAFDLSGNLVSKSAYTTLQQTMTWTGSIATPVSTLTVYESSGFEAAAEMPMHTTLSLLLLALSAVLVARGAWRSQLLETWRAQILALEREEVALPVDVVLYVSLCSAIFLFGMLGNLYSDEVKDTLVYVIYAVCSLFSLALGWVLASRLEEG